MIIWEVAMLIQKAYIVIGQFGQKLSIRKNCSTILFSCSHCIYLLVINKPVINVLAIIMLSSHCLSSSWQALSSWCYHPIACSHTAIIQLLVLIISSSHCLSSSCLPSSCNHPIACHYHACHLSPTVYRLDFSSCAVSSYSNAIDSDGPREQSWWWVTSTTMMMM